MSGSFLYFAYGSNLLAKRIHINTPSATRLGIGKILDFQLDFQTYSKRWRGASANIFKRPGRHVWGAIWQIDLAHLELLDRQEGVDANIYHRFEVEVHIPDGSIKKCYVYQQTRTDEQHTEDIVNLHEKRQPSKVYLNIIQKGAVESGLPEEYQKFLNGIPHNGYAGEVEIGTDLHLI